MAALVTVIPVHADTAHPVAVAADRFRASGTRGVRRLVTFPHACGGYRPDGSPSGPPPSPTTPSARNASSGTACLPAYGADGQTLVMLGWNFIQNSKARYVHRQRQQHAGEQQAA